MYLSYIFYTFFIDTGVPVGTTELILVLLSLYLFGGTRRYHRDYGTYNGIAELILIWKYL